MKGNKRIYRARWYNRPLNEFVTGGEWATSYEEAVTKLNAQWGADIELGERLKGRGGRVIWAGGRRGTIECSA